MSDIVWGNFTQQELDQQYDQTTLVPNTNELTKFDAQDSANIRTNLECIQDISYGPTVMERLDFFPVATKCAPVVIYHHGGAWTRFNKDQCSYLAPPFVAAGINVLVLDFASAPKVSLDEIIRQNRAAVAWAWHNADKYGWDRDKIHCIGHSSGGHISAMMLITDWEGDYGLSMNIIKSVTTCSGIYELEPARLSYRNTYLDLTVQAAIRNSPIRHIPENDIPITMAWGSGELDEFQRQSKEFSTAWSAAGHTVNSFVLNELNHFQVSREIVNQNYPVLANILKNITC